MTTVPGRVVQHIKQRGNAVYVTLPVALTKRLGWNLNDVLAFDVINSSMVLTKVELPKVNALRKEP